MVQSLDSLRTIYLNARSVKAVNKHRNKLVQLESLIHLNSPDILAITETWLTSDIHDQEVIPPNYVTYRKDRQHVHDNKVGDLEPRDEILVCEIHPPSLGKLALVLCYRPPSADLEPFTDNMATVLTNIQKEYRNCCIVGDFNLPRVDWSTCTATGGGKESKFCEVINNHFLHQHNLTPSNSSGNLLDLVFSNFPESLSAINEVPTVFDTDHAILEFMIKCKSQPKRGISRKVFNFKAADWEGLRSDQSLSDLEEEMGKHSDIDSAWQTWRSTVQAAMVKYIPSRQLKNSSTPPWVDSEVRHVRHKKYTAWKKAKRTDKPVHWAKFRKLRNKLKNILSSKYRNFLDGLSSSLQESPKRFWSFVRAKAKAKSLPSVVKNDGSIAQSAKEKANIFNQYFYSTFSPVDRNTSKPDIDIVSVDALSNLQFSVDVVQDVLASLDITKAVGPDNISPLILRKCADILAPSLTQLFNKSTTFGKQTPL
ncbi:hypothetical protein Bbelb_048590 [Branchiostoma belcheri]|nr:hypothetical protein Bbelb_048590 [Branchiostoma belcheri]